MAVSLTSDSAVTVSWTKPSGGDMITGYLVYYNLSDSSETIVTLNMTESSHIFTEENTSQHVYTVSVQALSEYLPSAIVGPVIVRG